jgi:hypothetical protein
MKSLTEDTAQAQTAFSGDGRVKVHRQLDLLVY